MTTAPAPEAHAPEPTPAEAVLAEALCLPTLAFQPVRGRPRYAKPRDWLRMSNAEWDAIRPFIENRGPGRPLRDARTRLDIIFLASITGLAWAKLNPALGRPDTNGRLFRRWTQAGLWKNLLFALDRTDCPPALKRLEHWICCAARRGMRLMGAAGIAIARLLGMVSALPLPPFMLPDPDMSERFQSLRVQTLRERKIRYTAALDRTFDRIIRHYTRRYPWSKLLAPL